MPLFTQNTSPSVITPDTSPQITPSITPSTAQVQIPAVEIPQKIVVYVDGACKGNPGTGGWGVYIEYEDGQTEERCGGEKNTTNNRMELMAAIEGIKHLPKNASTTLWTDSSYVQKGISEWIINWKKRGWKKADGKPVLNADLWQTLDALTTHKTIDWRWIKGHAGHAGNERADQLANKGCTVAV